MWDCGVPRERNIGGLQWEVNARGGTLGHGLAGGGGDECKGGEW